MQKGFVQFIVLGVVILAIVAAGAFYLGKQISKQPVSSQPGKQNQVVTSQSTPSSTSVVDETANWKTYTNTKFGIKFEHPTEYYTEDYNRFIYLKVPNRPKGQILDIPIMIWREITYPKEDMRKCGEKEDVTYDLRPTGCYKDITIGGVSGVKYARGRDVVIEATKPELQIQIPIEIIWRFGEKDVDKIFASFQFLN